ncbi:hypothetical protein IWW50_002696, partial [Coemansia erecta]
KLRNAQLIVVPVDVGLVVGQLYAIGCTQWIGQLTYHWVYRFLRASSMDGLEAGGVAESQAHSVGGLETSGIAESEASRMGELKTPPLPRALHPATTFARFNRHWQHEVSSGRQSLLRALARTFAGSLALCSLLRMLVFLRDVAQPIAVARILRELGQANNNSDDTKVLSMPGCVSALLLYTSVSLVVSVAEQHHIDLRDRAELAIHATLTCAVHQAHALSTHTSVGRLVLEARAHGTDLYSCGVMRTQELAAHIVQLTGAVWTPVRLVVGLYVFYRQVGWAILPGIAAALLYLPLRAHLLRQATKASARASQASSRRVALVAQLVENIVPVRMLGLASVLARQIRQLRNVDELEPTMRAASLSLAQSYVWTVCRTGGPLLSLFIYSVVAQRTTSLTAERVFIVHNVLRELLPLLIDAPHAFDCWWAAKQPYSQIKALLVLASPGAQDMQTALAGEAPTAKDNLAVSITSTSFSWPPKDNIYKTGFALTNVNMHVRKGQLVAVVGKVGAGKSSLISAILGEMDAHSPARVNGRIALVSQTPWLMSGTVRDNITFGLAYDASWFNTVTSICALHPDLRQWQFGEHTQVGSSGVALSGGQRMRVALARAVYSRASVYLLDDVLAAVDVHVAQQLLDRVLLGPRAALRCATRIVVTKDPAIIRSADLVYAVCDGRVELASKVCGTGIFSLSPVQPDDAVADAEMMSDDSTVVSDSGASNPCSVNSAQSWGKPQGQDKACNQEPAQISATTGTLDPVWYILRLCGKSAIVAHLATVIAHCIASHQAQLWLAQPIPAMSAPHALWHFALSATWWAADATLESATKWWPSIAWKRAIFTRSHDQLLESTAHAPLGWLSYASTGRILSMFTQAQHDVDTRLPAQLASIITFAVKMLLETWVIVTFHPLLVLTVLLVGAAMLHVVRISSKPLERVLAHEARARPLINEQFQESVAGAVTIRAFEAGHFVHQRLVDRLARHAQYRRTSDSIETWIDLVMTVLRESAISVAFAIALAGASTAATSPMFALRVDPANMALVQASITMLLARIQHTIRHSHLLRAILTQSSEYVKATQLAPEGCTMNPDASSRVHSAEKHTDICKPRSSALSVKFENVCASYNTDTCDPPLALRNMSFTIKAGQHIGIVGRTGSGKTSIAMSLLGLLHPHRGRILVGDINIAATPLPLRCTRVGIVPQSTYVLPGTVRDNLDPHTRHTDTELRRALDTVGLTGTELDCTRADQWSVGERQLLALARAILANVGVLVLDEATSSIDAESSQKIHATIRRCFSHCTVITIAH